MSQSLNRVDLLNSKDANEARLEPFFNEQPLVWCVLDVYLQTC